MSIIAQQVTKVDTDSYAAYHGLKFLARRRLVVVSAKTERACASASSTVQASVTLYITQQTHFDRVLSQVPRLHYCWIGEPHYSNLAFLVL